jgi:hypothetical protein
MSQKEKREQVPENSWRLYLEIVRNATATIDAILDGKPMGSLLNQFIYTLVFHHGVCVARWINNNKDLVIRLNAIMSFTKEEFEQLSREVQDSVEKLRA